VSNKKEKNPPRIVYRHGKQEEQIKDFLKMRQFIKKISQKMRRKRARYIVRAENGLWRERSSDNVAGDYF
jgi:hypothetical protein